MFLNSLYRMNENVSEIEKAGGAPERLWIECQADFSLPHRRVSGEVGTD